MAVAETLMAGEEQEAPPVEQVVPAARLTVRPVDAASVNVTRSLLAPGGTALPGQPLCAVEVSVTDPDLPESKLRLATLEETVTYGTPVHGATVQTPGAVVPLLLNVAVIEVSGAGLGVPVSMVTHSPGTLTLPEQLV